MRGGEGHRYVEIDEGDIRRHRRGGYLRIGEREMLATPEALETGLFGGAGDSRDRFGRHARSHVHPEQTELHVSRSLTAWASEPRAGRTRASRHSRTDRSRRECPP